MDDFIIFSLERFDTDSFKVEQLGFYKTKELAEEAAKTKLGITKIIPYRVQG